VYGVGQSAKEVVEMKIEPQMDTDGHRKNICVYLRRSAYIGGFNITALFN
jgi:hypothetical protein